MLSFLRSHLVRRTLLLTLNFFLILSVADLSSVEAAKSQKSKQKQSLKKKSAAAGKKKNRVVKAKAKKSPDLQAQIAKKAQKVLADLKSRPLRAAGAGAKMEIEAGLSKASWLQAVYQNKMVEASWATKMLADKRIFFEVLKSELGDQALEFYPKTIGLREFLLGKGLMSSNGKILVSGDALDAALYREFPAGFVVRPAVGVAPQENGRGIFTDSDWFVVELLNPNSKIMSARQLASPRKNPSLGEVASGEDYVIQENVITAADIKKKLQTRFFQEVRIHTYENRVVAGGIPERWVQTNLVSPDEAKKAEQFISRLLSQLPLPALSKMAFGFDVAVLDNGQMRIVDVVTNRGKSIQWSGYLDQPRVIAAYSKHFEGVSGLEFNGWTGMVIREGFANYLPYWQLKIEKSRPGWDKVLSYLPPKP